MAKNDKLTHLYTGMPLCDSFIEYLQPKAWDMIAWKSIQTKEPDLNGKQCSTWCFHGMSVINQSWFKWACLLLMYILTCVFWNKWRYIRTYSHLFTMWICFLYKELKLLFPFLSHKQIDEWMPRNFKKHFLNTRISFHWLLWYWVPVAFRTVKFIHYILPIQVPKYMENAYGLYIISNIMALIWSNHSNQLVSNIAFMSRICQPHRNSLFHYQATP